MMTIRKTEPNDLEKVMEIYTHAREVMKKSGNPNQWCDDKPYREQIIEDIADGNGYVVEDEAGICGVFCLLYAPVMLAFTYLTRELPQGLYLVWLILISAWGCDTCAYVVGVLIGKKKIFPNLSPKKSLEGCIGGVVGTVIIATLYGYFFVEATFPDKKVAPLIAIICGFGAVCSMVGDLAASAIKRNFGIKDYGKLIPGHGGIMDRFDSMIVTAPLVYFLATFLL